MGKRLFVGNLPWSVTSEELAQMFAPFGTVEFAEVKYKDLDRRQSRGIGFAQLSTDQEAEAAISSLNESEVGGRLIVVNHALPRTPRTDGPRHYSPIPDDQQPQGDPSSTPTDTEDLAV